MRRCCAMCRRWKGSAISPGGATHRLSFGLPLPNKRKARPKPGFPISAILAGSEVTLDAPHHAPDVVVLRIASAEIVAGDIVAVPSDFRPERQARHRCP